MEFQQYYLGILNGRELVEVKLFEQSANVRLMDSLNFENYKSGLQYKSYGEYVRRSPYYITIPNPGTWYLVIDPGINAGTIKALVRIAARYA